MLAPHSFSPFSPFWWPTRGHSPSVAVTFPSALCLLSVSLPHSAAHNKNAATPLISARLAIPCRGDKSAPAATTALGRTPHSHKHTQAEQATKQICVAGSESQRSGLESAMAQVTLISSCLSFCSPQLSPIKTHRMAARLIMDAEHGMSVWFCRNYPPMVATLTANKAVPVRNSGLCLFPSAGITNTA